MFEDIARRVLMGQKVDEIAEDLGYTGRHIRRLLHDPRLQSAYRKISEEFYSDFDRILRDEKMRPLQRAQAQAIRAQTLLTEVMETVRERIADGNAKATELKVGVDAAFGIIDRSKGELGTQSNRSTTNVQFQIGTDRTSMIKATIQEAGLDLSDLGYVEAEVVETKSSPMENSSDP